jgi:hypothetical protein
LKSPRKEGRQGKEGKKESREEGKGRQTGRGEMRERETDSQHTVTKKETCNAT